MPKGSTSTPQRSQLLEAALAKVPDAFRGKVVSQYLGVRDAFSGGAFDTTGLRAGVFAEVVLRLLQHELTGSHTPFGNRLPQFDAECLRFQGLAGTTGHESLRVVIPRALNFLYTIRNKRGIGHVGGDVEANVIDAATCVRVCDWVVCELLRLYHGLSLEEAQVVLNNIASRELPSVWSVNGRKRVLNTALDYRSQSLLLLYTESEGSVLEEDLQEWIEYPDASKFRTRVLRPLHGARLLEWDQSTGTVTLSPLGVAHVEEKILTDSRVDG